LYTLKRKEVNLIENHTPLPYGLGNPYRNLMSKNSKDFAQKPQRNCTFMNSASAWVASGTNMEINGSRKISLYGL
jgi:hypothetical protein